MCKAIEDIKEEARLQGRLEGHSEGHSEGRLEECLQNLKNLMDSTGWTLTQAMDALKIPASERDLLAASIYP